MGFESLSDKKKMSQNPIHSLTQRLLNFRDERDWQQFHSLKDLILSLNLEASELLELTQWKSEADFEALAQEPEMKARLEEECADVFLYLLLVAERAGIDLAQVADKKIDANGVKYPVDKAKGVARKYDQL